MKFFKVHIILLLLIGLLAPAHAQQCIPEATPGMASFAVTSEDAIAYSWLVNGVTVYDSIPVTNTATTDRPQAFDYTFSTDGTYEISVIPISDSGVWGDTASVALTIYKSFYDFSVQATWAQSNMNVCNIPGAAQNMMSIGLNIATNIITEGEKYAIVYTINDGAEQEISFTTKKPRFDINAASFKASTVNEFKILRVLHGPNLECVINYRSDPRIMELNMRGLPLANIGEDITVCKNDTFTIKVDSDYADSSYVWNDTIRGTLYKAVANATDTIWLKVTSPYNCSSTDTAIVIVNPLPVLDITDFASSKVVTDTMLCGEQVITLDAGLDGTIYKWSTGEISNSILIGGISSSATDTMKYISVKVTSGFDCVASDSIKIIKCIPPDKTKVPTALTPNGDNINDEWEIPYLEYYPEAIVDVYDRWGRTVFHSVGYKKKWDGKYEGKDQPMDNYYFIITLDSKTEPIRGNVMIIR